MLTEIVFKENTYRNQALKKICVHNVHSWAKSVFLQLFPGGQNVAFVPQSLAHTADSMS